MWGFLFSYLSVKWCYIWGEKKAIWLITLKFKNDSILLCCSHSQLDQISLFSKKTWCLWFPFWLWLYPCKYIFKLITFSFQGPILHYLSHHWRNIFHQSKRSIYQQTTNQMSSIFLWYTYKKIHLKKRHQQKIHQEKAEPTKKRSENPESI